MFAVCIELMHLAATQQQTSWACGIEQFPMHDKQFVTEHVQVEAENLSF